LSYKIELEKHIRKTEVEQITRGQDTMTESDKINEALRSSKANVELEGLEVSNMNDEICKKLLTGKISDSEANRLILLSHGILI
jgi:hypothetical protein